MSTVVQLHIAKRYNCIQTFLFHYIIDPPLSMSSQAGDVKIISDSELKAVTTVIVIDDMFDTCGHFGSSRAGEAKGGSPAG